MTWVQKDRWRYWNGDKVVELRHRYIEYRPTERHQHFILPYDILGPLSIAAMGTDLREWDWMAERSALVSVSERDSILEQMRQAISVGEVSLQFVSQRPVPPPGGPLSSLQDLSDYMFGLANTLRDSGLDEAAADVFYSAMGYTWPITECLERKLKTLRQLEARQLATLKREQERLRETIGSAGQWLHKH